MAGPRRSELGYAIPAIGSPVIYDQVLEVICSDPRQTALTVPGLDRVSQSWVAENGAKAITLVAPDHERGEDRF